MFSNQKIFLDVKDYSKIDRLEADIREFGGTIEKFLSKEITCVVTNRTRTDNLLLRKDVSTPTSTQSRRPSAGGSRVLSRGQCLLMRSNSLKDTAVCDPVAFAQRWGIKVVTLDTVVQAINRQLPSCSSSSPVTKQSVKSHNVVKRRKFSGASVKGENTESNIRPFLTKFSGAFIKFEDTESNYRPFFKQYSSFPHLNLEGDLSNGIFKCAEIIRPAAVRKDISTIASARKQKVWSKRGYCECCDVMYDDFNQHLISDDHQRFAKHTDNFADLDKLIDQISLSGIIPVLLTADDNCTHRVSSETSYTACPKELHLMNFTHRSNVDVESDSCHNVNLWHSQSHDHQSKPEESDEAVDAAENCTENGSVSVEQIDKNNRSPMHVSVSAISKHFVKSENHDADDDVEKVSNTLDSQTVAGRCDDGSVSATFNALSQSVDSCKVTEALDKKKLCDISVDRNPSQIDDMPDFISSDYVVNLLELLCSENSVNSALHDEEAAYHYHTMEVYKNDSSIPPMNAAALPCVPAACSYDTSHTEVLPNEKEHGQQTNMTNVTDCSLLLTSVQSDLLGTLSDTVMMEQHRADVDKSTTKSEHLFESLPGVKLSNLPTFSSTDAVALSEPSVITNSSRNQIDARSRNVKDDADASVFRLCEVQHDCSFLPCVDHPATCATVITTESAVPVYARSQAKSVCMSDDHAFSPAVSSSLIADSFYLHDKLLTMAYELDTAEQNELAQSCSSVQASYKCSSDCVDECLSDDADVSTSNNNLCLSVAFSPTSCFSESSAAPIDSGNTGLCTPVHSSRDSSEDRVETLAVDGNISTWLTSFCQTSPLPDIVSRVGSGCVSESSQNSVSCMGLQRNTEMNDASDRKVDACLVLETGDSQINCYPFKTVKTEIKSDVTGECISEHESEDYYESNLADTAQLETRSVEDSSYCVKSLGNVSGFPVPSCFAFSLQPEVENKCSVVGSESCDTTEQEADENSDSASTLVYSCDYMASSLLDHVSDTHSPDGKNSETTLDYREPSVSNANSTWKVTSFVDCRMRLVRTEAVCPALSAENENKVSSRPETSDFGPDLNDTTEPLEETHANSESISILLCSCDCPESSVLEQSNNGIKMKSETVGDYRELPVSKSSTNSTWKVNSFVGGRMRLVRSNAVFPASSTDTVSPDSGLQYAKLMQPGIEICFITNS